MLGPLPNNTLLAWLQDKSNDEFRSTEALTTMFNFFATGAKTLSKDCRRTIVTTPSSFHQGCQKEVIGLILHHLAQFPSRLGATTTAYDGHWFLTANQPIGGSHITYLLPTTLLDKVEAAQCYKPAHIQQELAHQLDASQLAIEVNDANLKDLEGIITRPGMWIPNQYAKLCLWC